MSNKWNRSNKHIWKYWQHRGMPNEQILFKGVTSQSILNQLNLAARQLSTINLASLIPVRPNTPLADVFLPRNYNFPRLVNTGRLLPSIEFSIINPMPPGFIARIREQMMQSFMLPEHLFEEEVVDGRELREQVREIRVPISFGYTCRVSPPNDDGWRQVEEIYPTHHQFMLQRDMQRRSELRQRSEIQHWRMVKVGSQYDCRIHAAVEEIPLLLPVQKVEFEDHLTFPGGPLWKLGTVVLELTDDWYSICHRTGRDLFINGQRIAAPYEIRLVDGNEPRGVITFTFLAESLTRTLLDPAGETEMMEWDAIALPAGVVLRREEIREIPPPPPINRPVPPLINNVSCKFYSPEVLLHCAVSPGPCKDCLSYEPRFSGDSEA